MERSNEAGGCISVCFNANSVSIDTPIEIGSDATLRSANNEESTFIDGQLDQLASSDLFAATHPLLGEWRPKHEGSGSTFHRYAQPRSYVVLETKNYQAQSRHQAFLNVAERPLSFGFNFLLAENGSTARHWQADYLFQLGNPAHDQSIVTLAPLNQDDVDCYSRLWGVTDTWTPENWLRPMAMMRHYAQVQTMPARSPFKYLALCSIIEGILTHKPSDNDPTESIGRQIRRKMPLVTRRSPQPANAKVYFPHLSAEQTDERLWKALYGLRSEIAHGDEIATFDVKSKGRIDLVDLNTCVRYVDAVSRMLLRHMCLEPQLLNDLRYV